jgi:hypothetical protein
LGSIQLTTTDSITVCGETLNATDVENKSSALEGICDSGGGKTQLARQLIALALNCLNSKNSGWGDGTSPCAGISAFESVYNSCDATCIAGGTNAQLSACINQVDCLNNGGTWNGSCTIQANNCENNPLLFQDSPAGSSQTCNDARKSDCTIFSTVGTGAGQCTTDSLP